MKSHSFSKKLLSLFLAVIMALSCCTAAFSAFAASADTEKELYEFNNEYDALGWVKTTDEQKLSALLDLLDNILAKNMGTMVQDINLNSLLGVSLGLPTINLNLTSVDGVLSTVNSVRLALSSGPLYNLLGGDVSDINLKGVLKGYAANGRDGGLMTRENSTSKEIVAGILNILYMNTNNYAYNSDHIDNQYLRGGRVIQSILNGTLNIGGLQNIVQSAIGGPIYDVIANAAGLPVGFQTNAVNNLAVTMLSGVAANLTTFAPGVFSKVGSDGTTWYFQGDKNQRLSLEEWAFDTIQKALVNQCKNINGDPVFKGDEFKLEVKDAAMSDFSAIMKPVLKNSLVPLFSTLSVDFFHIPQITRMYADWKMKQPGFKAPSNESELNNLWTKANVEAWINADTKAIATYLSGLKDWNGEAMCPTITASSDAATVQAELVKLFKSLDRHNKENIDVAYLFTNMLFSPVAKALGCETGVLNLNVRDYYFGNFGAFFDMNAVKNNALNSAYPLVKEFFKALVPGFDGWEAVEANETIDSLVAKFVKVAGKMIGYIADNSSEAILNDFHTKHPGEELTEDTIEEAITPLLISFVYHGKTFEQIHPEKWAQVKDLNGFIYVLMEEYLKKVLPEYDYSSLAYKNGELDANLETVLLPMARDCVAVLVQGIVPLKWDVYKQGGVVNGKLRDNTSIFDLANNVLCFFANDLGIAKTLGFDNLDTKSGSIWTNVDKMFNKALPAFSSLFVEQEASFNSKDFFYTTILNGVLNMSEVNNSAYGHAKKGFSALLYNLVYLLAQSAPLNKTPIVNVVYDVLKNSINTVLGARNAGDNLGQLIPNNTGLQPFTDLIQNKVMSGGTVAPSADCTGYNAQNGVIGVLFARLAENTFEAGKLCKNYPDTVGHGVLNIVNAVNSAISFIPQLSRNTLRGATGSFTRGIVNTKAAFDQGNNANYIAVDNNANGIKRAYVENGKATPIDNRYFVKVTKIVCTNDSNLSANINTAYTLKDGKYVSAVKNVIAPGQRLYFQVTGTPSSYDGKNFEITYDILDKNSKTLGTYKTTAVLDVSEISWFNQVFENGALRPEFKIDPTNSGKKQIMFPGTNKVAVERTDFFGQCSYVPAGKNHMAITYPKYMVIDPNNPGQLPNMRLAAINKYSFNGWNLHAVYPYSGSTNTMTPSFDKEGNILDYTRTDYYYPVTDQWLVGKTTLEQNGRVYSYTKTRPHVEYSKEKAKTLPGYKATWNGSECTGITINYNKDIYYNITCATPIPGTYQKMPINIEVAKKDYVPYSWIYPTGETIKPGHYTINMFVDAVNGNDNGKKIQIDVDVADTNKLPVLQTVYNEASHFVNTHAAEELKDAAQLKALQEEVAKARVLLDVQLSINTIKTFANDVNTEITALRSKLDAAKASVDSSKETANELVNKVIKNFEALDMDDYENVSFNLTRDVYNYACRLVKAEYDNPTWVPANSKDEKFNKLGQYKFLTNDGLVIDQCMYTTFMLNLQSGKYEAAFGLNANSVEGKDYKFGYEEPQRDPVTNQIKYKYSNNATVAEMKEAIKLYELYNSKLVVKSYDANDNALMKEILCATGAKSDAMDAALKTYITSNITVGADGSISYTAGITPKYGALQNGKLVNKGYTEQTWKAYTDALAAAVNAVKAGNGKVSDLQALRVNVMVAENRLEEVAIKDVTYTYTFADGHNETVTAAEGTAPTAPANTATTCKPNGDHKNHTTTTYTWPEFVPGTTEYKEVASEKVEACKYDVQKTEPTRGENGKIVYTCPVCKDTYEEVIPALGVTVTVEEAKLGTVAIKATAVDGNAITGDATKHVVKYQTSYTLEAKANADAKFVGWYSGNKLISTQAAYTTTAYADTTYTPVFQEVNDNVFTVTFIGLYGNIVAEYASTELAGLTKLPDAPNDYIGYKFTSWGRTLDQVKALKESTVLYAQYEKDATDVFTVNAKDCTINVDGTNYTDVANNVSYNAKVVVTPKSGTATSWLMNGKVASYDASFTFYCGADTTVTFTTESATKAPVVSILSDTENETTHRVTFLASRTVPEGYTLIESGFVYGKGAMTADDLTLENVGVATSNGKVNQLKNANTSPNGQFSITFGIKNQAAPASARAYVVYADAEGATHVVYSDVSVHNFAK